jgi:8-hydroxy-5-deazaflavin:NADPH oxidoreductase
MQIAIVGAGNVGGALGRRWAEKGHDVTFVVREGSEVKGGLPPRAHVSSSRDATADADVIVLATPWAAAEDIVRSLGDVRGKILVDATNPLKAGLALDHGPQGESGAERIAARAAGARVVKAFNTTGFNNMTDPTYGGEPTVMFYAGDDPSAKEAVARLATDLGFDAVDAGPLMRARQLEHLALLWISLAASGMGREIAFKLARR